MLSSSLHYVAPKCTLQYLIILLLQYLLVVAICPSLPCCPIVVPMSNNTDLHHVALSLLLCALCCTVHHVMYWYSYVHYAALYNMYSLLRPLVYQRCTMYHCCSYVPLLQQLPLLLLCTIVAPMYHCCTKYHYCYDCVLVRASLWPKLALKHTHTVP